jgi:hypothetical protein
MNSNWSVNTAQRIILGENESVWLVGDEWHGLLYQTPEGIHALFAIRDPEWAEIAHQDLGWDYEDLEGEWVLFARTPNGGEIIYGPRKGADDPDLALRMILTLLRADYSELVGATVRSGAINTYKDTTLGSFASILIG